MRSDLVRFVREIPVGLENALVRLGLILMRYVGERFHRFLVV